MDYVYLICAALGGAVLLCQLLMQLVGVGFHGDDFGDHHGSLEVSHDTAGEHDQGDHHGSDDHHSGVQGSWSAWLFGMVSLRTVVAGLTFFGLTGMAMRSAGWTLGLSLLVAASAGSTALASVHWLIRTLTRLRSDGTLRIGRALGMRGSVYIPIPPEKSGLGKVQVRMGDRIVELKAMTSFSDRLATGAMVVVTAIVNHDTVQVEPIGPTRLELGSSP